jgi:hypothetical protein
MDRSAFESLIEAVLAETIQAAHADGETRQPAPCTKQLASIRYGEDEAQVGSVVSRLTTGRFSSSPIAVPSSDFLPPCF